MNILYLGYWGVADGLSVSTIYPHLRILSEMEAVSSIHYFSIERDGVGLFPMALSKVHHIPLASGHGWGSKLNDFLGFPRQLIAYCQSLQIDHIICRGAPAGGIGHLVHRKTGIPYIVESFEPHAEYMRASGVWPYWHPKYWVERYIEHWQKRTAAMLLPVSENYRQKLLQEGIAPERIRVAPCAVDAEQFSFSETARLEIRQQLGIAPDRRVGVYVGKFGGIYFEQEALQFFREAFAFWPELFVLVLTPQPDQTRSWLLAHGLPVAQLHVTAVPHAQVPHYLSAADMAFSLIRPAEARRYCSPIKNGEYWANGLPILLPADIGDDSDLVSRHPILGVVFDMDNMQKAFAKVRVARHGEIADMVGIYRSYQAIREAYASLF